MTKQWYMESVIHSHKRKMAKICCHRIASRWAPPPSSRNGIMTTPSTTGLKNWGEAITTPDFLMFTNNSYLYDQDTNKQLINTVLAEHYWTACKLKLQIMQPLEEWMKLLLGVNSKSDLTQNTTRNNKREQYDTKHYALKIYLTGNNIFRILYFHLTQNCHQFTIFKELLTKSVGPVPFSTE